MDPRPPDRLEKGPRRTEEGDPQGWQQCAGLNERQAEELLDWLEANGFAQREVSFGDGTGFTVRWRR
jgi:hypothetical protein